MLGALVADLEPETLSDLRIVVSELVSNAVKYGPGNPVHVELDVRRPRVSGEIVNHGDPARAPRIHERPGAHGGYGMRLVDSPLHAAWGVREGSTDVWFELGG